MIISMKKYKQMLMDNNIRPSYTRIRIFEYLNKKKNHPTVEDIYISLIDDLPTLSKTTVYNTLNTFEEAGLVKVLNIDSNEARYDTIMENHGHFKCEKCRNIYDFPVNINVLSSDRLDGFRIKEKDVYFKGICNICL